MTLAPLRAGWLKHGISLEERIKSLDSRWAYYFGFGLPITLASYWSYVFEPQKLVACSDNLSLQIRSRRKSFSFLPSISVLFDHGDFIYTTTDQP